MSTPTQAAPVAQVSQAQILQALCSPNPNAMLADRAIAHNLTCLAHHAEEARKALAFAQVMRSRIGKPTVAIARPDANGNVAVADGPDPAQAFMHNMQVAINEVVQAIGLAGSLQATLQVIMGEKPPALKLSE